LAQWVATPVFVDHSHLLIVIYLYVHVKTVFAIYHPHIYHH